MMNYKLNGYNIGSDDYLLLRGKICVPKNSELVHKILYEAQNGTNSIHPGSNKMYNNLKKIYWWPGMKRDISEFVSKCLICQQVKRKSYHGFCIQITLISEKERCYLGNR
ncbi:integrase [Gossypium australe]|uniref:Integrase n=1 Tax=Gossypium australe TaxID=47621 RepID=A0A5B6V941_9ROSI|nr:integrase [Gossypium australe]